MSIFYLSANMSTRLLEGKKFIKLLLLKGPCQNGQCKFLQQTSYAIAIMNGNFSYFHLFHLPFCKPAASIPHKTCQCFENE